MKKLITFFCLIFSPSFAFAQLQFLDGFENYNAGQQLACQNPTEWTTWNLMPCDSAEDPYISTNQAFGGTKSVLVSHSNDPVKQLGNFTFGPSIIFFQIYVSNNTTGYFGIQNVFEPPSNFEWGLECYFNPSGQGILKTGFLGSNQLNFNYEYDTWLMIKIIVNIDFGDSYFWMNDNLLHTWDWSDNGLLAKQLASIDFFGFSDTEMYIDDFFFQFDYCLSCPPPNPPVNLTAQTINNPNPMVQLNWQDNSNDEYIFEILRKKGNASVPGIFEFLSRVSFDETTFFDSTVIEDSTYTYGIRAYNVYGYSDTSNFATITVEPVPVELVSFTVDVINNNVQLNWTTATETNN